MPIQAFGMSDRQSMMQHWYSLWQNFWKFTEVENHYINWIDAPRVGDINFTIPLYLFLLVLFIVLLVRTRTMNRYSLIRAFTFSCIAAGVLFAVRMDYTWCMNWRLDQAYLYPKSIPERQALLLPEPWPHVIAAGIKEIIPPGRSVKIYSNNRFFSLALKYYLLPVEVSEKGSYIVVYDNAVLFDPARNTLRKENQVIATNAALIYKFDEVFIYQEREPDK
ncbi:MAG TPA: hypothetical protein VL197_03090 [Nitrospirota bacterium]|nr:hypothetical protein [Nitrospirota bacterium]